MTTHAGSRVSAEGAVAAPADTPARLDLKFRPPPPRPGMLVRERLVDMVRTAREPLVAITAAGGFGKSTLLAHSAARLPRVAFVRLDETDNDPISLMDDLAASLAQVEPLDPQAVRAATAPAPFDGFQAPSRFVHLLAGIGEPVVLMLDDGHLVTDRRALDWLAWIMQRLPAPHRLVLAGRRLAGLPFARLWTEGRLLEVMARDLAFDATETRDVASQAGLVLTPDELAWLLERTEGWPLAVHLLIRSGNVGGRFADPGADPLKAETGIARYLRSELVDAIDPATRDWLLRTSVLDELGGPVCDAVLGTSGSLRRLRQLEADNLLLVPLDERRTSYRYHALYRSLLQDELEVHLPGESATIARRAAEWYEGQGQVSRAARFARRTGDMDDLAAFVGRHALATFWGGGMATVVEWLSWFDRPGVRERYPLIAVFAAWAEILRGRAAEAAQWLEVAQRSVAAGLGPGAGAVPGGSPAVGAWVAALRATMMPAGVRQFEADVDAALEGIEAAGPLAPQVRLLAVIRHMVRGELEAADAAAREATTVQRVFSALPGLSIVTAERAVIALERGDSVSARDSLASGLRIVEVGRLEEYVTSALVFAVAARVAVAEGDTDGAREHLARVHRLRPLSTEAIPWFAVQVRAQAIRAALGLREVATARLFLSEIMDVLRVRRDLGAIGDEAEELRRMVAARRESAAGPWALTAAEMRVLAYLPTHLTFREIAERIGVSMHTVKTQSVSIYGKLEVSSRRGAIERAVADGLLDRSALHAMEGSPPIA